jgi:hypothetical protein
LSYHVHTLKQLQNDKLTGIKRLVLSENLSEFPQEIFKLADSLEVLELSNNLLSELPEDLHRLKNLKILFCSNNCFTHLPEAIGQCEKLEMIGFKNNQIVHVPDASLPLITRWLILTDNKITQLPESFGKLVRLQKLALAGNNLTELPASFAQCENLELIRLAANQLAEFPDVLLTLPKLAWLAFSGNPFCAPRAKHDEFKSVSFSDLALGKVLGQGASGVISKANWVNNQFNFATNVAVKVFKGEITSDGFPEDELDACLSTGHHENLIKPLAKITHPDCSALIMDLIPQDYVNLGQPPSLQSCTRDTFTQGQYFSIKQIYSIVEQMHNLVQHFKAKEISHGDLYAHNVLINEQGHILCGDFGAASKYQNLSDPQKFGIQKIENRAFKYFIEDLLSVCDHDDVDCAQYQLCQQLSR